MALRRLTAPGGVLRANQSAALPVFLFLALVLSLALDRVPRFYQGDSTAYLSAGLNNWIPLDRSWSYGYGSRWLMVATHSTVAVFALQAGLLALGLWLLQRAMAVRPSALRFPAWLPGLLFLDPLNQAYARFWLTDAPACGLFLCFLACVPVDRSPGRLRLAFAFGIMVVTIFLRVAFLPITLATLLCCLVATVRPARHRRITDASATGPGLLRRRLLLLCVAPVIAATMLGFANGWVAHGANHDRFFINRKSSFYTMGVFLPALRFDDFRRAGIPMTHDEFDALRLKDYRRREQAVWADGPSFVGSLLQQKLHLRPEDAAFEQRCAAVVHSALLHHPQDLLRTYLWSTLLYLDPADWQRGFPGEMGFNRSLPDWVLGMMRWEAGEKWPANLNAVHSPLPTVLGAVIWGYPLVLALGIVASLRLLLRRAPFDGADLLAAAMLASFATAPLYSHLVKPRYMLSAVLLSEWTIGLLVVAAHDTRRNRRLFRQA